MFTPNMEVLTGYGLCKGKTIPKTSENKVQDSSIEYLTRWAPGPVMNIIRPFIGVIAPFIMIVGGLPCNKFFVKFVRPFIGAPCNSIRIDLGANLVRESPSWEMACHSMIP